MADRDVKLVIRARDAASKSLDKISESLDEFNKSAGQTGDSSGKASAALAKVKGEISKLQTELKNLSNLGDVSGNITKIENAIGRLETSLSKSGGEFTKLRGELDAASKKTEGLRTDSERLTKSLDEQTARTAELRKERTLANRELRKSETAYAAVQRQIAKQGSTGTASRSAEVIFGQSVEGARAAANEAAKAYETQKAAQDATRQSLRTLNQELKGSEKTQASLTKELQRTSAATEQTEKNLTEARQELKKLQTAATEAARSVGQTTLSQEKLADSTERAEAEIRELVKTQKALERFDGGDGVFTDPQTAAALRKQREEVDNAREAWQRLERQTQSLRASLSGVDGPTNEASQAFRASAAAARQARLEYERQQAVLNRFPAAAARAQSLRGAFGGFNDDSRQALSLAQRLRGEVLALTASFIGFYGAIQNIGGVINAFQAVEAAQNRLGSIFGQNEEAVANELAFLERQARRLGVSFQTLAQDYSKFAVAANAANIESGATRKIFLSLAEAGRVNKLSTDQLGRAFKAFEQIISKGKFTAEEVRQQLGEALPGAFFILADALGVTGAELDDLLKQGKVFATQDNLLKFADALNRRFGDQLAASLDSTTANIGRFQDAIFQAQRQVGEGGFIDALNEALVELDGWFRSREGRDFFLSLGAALGKFTLILAEVPQYFDEIASVIQLLIGLKVAQWITGVVSNFRNLNVTSLEVSQSFERVGNRASNIRSAMFNLGNTIRNTRGNLTNLNANLKASVSSLTFARTRAVAFRGATVALRGALAAAATGARIFWTALGGPIGIIITGLTFLTGELLTSWATGVDASTRAIDEHQRILNEVVGAYEELGDKTEDWAKSIEGVTVDQANANVRALEKDFDSLINKIAGTGVATFGTLFDTSAKEVRDLQNQLSRGEISIQDFQNRLMELYDATENDAFRDVAEEILELGRQALAAEKRLGEGSAAAIALGSDMDGLEENVDATGASIEELSGATEEVTESFEKGETALQDYGATLNQIKGFIPELADEMRKLEKLAKLDEIIQAGGVPQTIEELRQGLDLIGRARQAITDEFTNYEAQFTAQRGSATGQQLDQIVSEATRLADQLGVSARDILTVISYETGGTFNPDQPGPITQHGQHRGLIQFGEPQARRFGYEPGQSIPDQFQAIRGYFEDVGIRPGDGLLQLYASVNAGSRTAINASDANNGGAPGTVLDKVNDQMDGHKKKVDGLLAAYNSTVEATRETLREEQRLGDERERQIEATENLIADKEFEIAQQALINDGKNRQAAIEEAIRSARAQNPEITEEEIAKVTELTGKLYDQQNRLEGVKAAEAEVNRLIELRRNLMEQIDYYTNQGDTTRANQLKEQLTGVNQELEDATNKAIAMWRAIGGPEADSAIAKLETTRLQVQDLGSQSFITGEQINNMLASGLTNALDQFAQAVANGENAVEALGRAFLQFASDFLIEIGKMIVQQALLNALQAGGGTGGGVGGFFAGLIGGIFHEGGVVGANDNVGRPVAASWFNNARRYHQGGIAGLKPGEMPAILKEGEVIDPGDGSIASQVFGNMMGKGGQGGGSKNPLNLKIVNAFDSGDVVSEGLSTSAGEQSLLNVVKSNPSGFRAALDIE
jgi:tape measure domain-containing protein